MNLLVRSFAADVELENAVNGIKNLTDAIAPYKLSLSNDDRKGLRVVGTSRLGLVEIVNRLATQYDNKLSKTENASDLSFRINYLHMLKTYKMAAQHLLEVLDDTDKALGNDIMTFVDKFSTNLRSARKFDGDLDEAMKELDDYNARFGKIMDEEDTQQNTATDASNNQS
jgi:hypothetical protein